MSRRRPKLLVKKHVVGEFKRMEVKPGIASLNSDLLEASTAYIQGPLLKHLERLTRLVEGKEAEVPQLEASVGMLITASLTYIHSYLESPKDFEIYMIDFFERLMALHKKIEIEKTKS
jgi:hypothetical protein